MKSSTRRTIPPPIDLSIPGSNPLGTQSRTVLDKSSMGGPQPYTYDTEYVLDSKEAMLSVPTTAEMPLTAATLWSPPSLSEAMLPQSNPPIQMTAISDGSLTSEQYESTLVPNRRRRSRSECGHRPLCYPSALSNEASPSSELSKPSRSRLSSAPYFSPASFVPQRSASSVSRSKHELKASSSTDALAMMGKRNKLWASIAHLTSNASAVLDLDGSSNKTPTKEKTRRPGTSPVTVSSDTPSIGSEGSDSGRTAGVDMWKHGKNSRPSTASSATSGSSRSPLRLSKFEWPKQWRKRLSLLLSSSPVSPASLHSSTPSTSSTYSSSSLNLPPTPLTPASGDQCLHPLESLEEGHSQDLLQIPNKRNRSAPNLKLPPLSKEDLGKVNAYFAPPPPVHAVEAFNGFSRHRATSSDPKMMKSMLPLPSKLPKFPSSLKPPPVVIQPSVHLESDTDNASTVLPLSPVSSTSWNDMEDDSGVIYLTVVEDDWNDESGEAGLRLVEVPR
ncbi:hypothetical protein AGABI2DRAFT_141680 [Agaricus bisporus var. bisporus H97]|uniref:hypothetical protein n=1 Tax=Agaricus bisporus var. bisporus (strain H97 / ATCC MYA-4626 / FGSC 10389) TaxID=936046 RepID=UPI00029F6621|nr:hypothetical protein AGABI2DRAFT_141680 [Agaricus bisporus var. bisporus H97]EKV48948.1 hypothetical protein AGABI2DRAFT_141680 [Agaricus bisporus var. bisporus H97]